MLHFHAYRISFIFEKSIKWTKFGTDIFFINPFIRQMDRQNNFNSELLI